MAAALVLLVHQAFLAIGHIVLGQECLIQFVHFPFHCLLRLAWWRFALPLLEVAAAAPSTKGGPPSPLLLVGGLLCLPSCFFSAASASIMAQLTTTAGPCHQGLFLAAFDIIVFLLCTHRPTHRNRNSCSSAASHVLSFHIRCPTLCIPKH